MLNQLNNKFINLSLKTKIEFYLLPLLLLYLIYYSFQNLINSETDEIKNSVNISQFENKKFDGSFLELFNQIEKNAKDLNIQVKSLNNKKNIIDLKVYSKITDIPRLIKRIENLNNFTNISSINIYDKNDLDFYLIDFTIDLNKYYLKRIEKDEDIKATETQEKSDEIKEIKIPILEEKITYELKAIIADYVLINDIWIKKNENLNNFKLIEINKDYVLLQNDEKILKLELANEEYLKNIY
ncbi:MAG: hypothetical protein KA438_07915 [Aliarcobacter sp.]|nr:hypothetical protein [Aliarcobacter sp.]